MTPENIVLIVLIFLAAIIFTFTQWIGPRRIRARISSHLTKRGWIKVPHDRDHSWVDIMTLAIEDRHGAFQTSEHDETVGPITMHVKRTERRSGRTLELYRDTSTSQYRYTALGVRELTVDTRSGPLSAFGRRRRSSTSRELWIGEARRIPVNGPEMVYSGAQEIFGSTARKIALSRGVDPGSIPLLASPSDVKPARSVRELLLARTDLVQNLMAKVYLGPRAWVLIVPLPRLGRHMEDVLSLTTEISKVIDR